MTQPDHEFKQLGGKTIDGMPSVPSPVFQTAAGTRYLRSPGVVMIARPKVLPELLSDFLAGFAPDLGFAEYLKDPVVLTPGTQLAKIAGQTCYLSFGSSRTKNDQASKYFANIMSSGHGSVLEHAAYSFLLYGVSRSLTHELVRHRAGTAFSQVSQRYVDAHVVRFVERPEYQNDPELHARFEASIDLARREYDERTSALLDRQKHGTQILSGEAKRDLRKKVQQAARSCLPNETEAPIVFTANVRALRHTIEMRLSEHAEVEIRAAFWRIFLCMRLSEPTLFDDYAIVDLSDGTKAVNTPFRKV